MDLSIEQVREQLHKLLNPSNQNLEYPANWIRDMFADSCVYVNESTQKMYKAGYTVDGGVVALSDERVEVYPTYQELTLSQGTTDGTINLAEIGTFTSLETLSKEFSFTREIEMTIETLHDEIKPTRTFVFALGKDMLDDKDSTWVHIINFGTYQHDEYGEVSFSQEKYNSWKANLEAGVIGGLDENGKPCIAIDYEHSMDVDVKPEDKKAAGFMYALELRNDKEVWAFIKFSSNAANSIKAGEWKWFSISEVASGITDQKTGENTGSILLGGAITNRPFIPDLNPIQLKDLRASKVTILEQQLADEKKKTETTERKAHEVKVQAYVTKLENLGLPPAVIADLKPALLADGVRIFNVSIGGKSVELTEHIVTALEKLSKTGFVKLGQLTTSSTVETLTLNQAKEVVLRDLKAQGKSDEAITRISQTDLTVMARKKFPHLKGE